MEGVDFWVERVLRVSKVVYGSRVGCEILY